MAVSDAQMVNVGCLKATAASLEDRLTKVAVETVDVTGTLSKLSSNITLSGTPQDGSMFLSATNNQLKITRSGLYAIDASGLTIMAEKTGFVGFTLTVNLFMGSFQYASGKVQMLSGGPASGQIVITSPIPSASGAATANGNIAIVTNSCNLKAGANSQDQSFTCEISGTIKVYKLS